MARSIRITSLKDGRFPMHGTTSGGSISAHKFTEARVSNTGGTRAYLVVYSSEGMPLTEIGKQMSFSGGNIYISNGGKKVKIGTYRED